MHKLNYFITAGYELGREIDSVSAINFLSELTQDETFMGDSNFTAQWTDKEAARTKQYRLDHGIIKPSTDEPIYRPCKSGKKCLRFEKRKPAAAKGSGAYCGTPCAAGDRARQKRALAGGHDPVIRSFLALCLCGSQGTCQIERRTWVVRCHLGVQREELWQH